MKKPAVAGEEHPPPAVNVPTVKEPTAAREEHLSPAVKKPVAAGDPSPSVNAPIVKEPVATGEGHPAVKQPVEAAGKKLVKEHLVRTEERHAKQSVASCHSHP
ncbi:hypothetical protein B296_00006185 [Ensete ventricosum]|uniref:Uncharacterized protein n=1 Tax=Ensete ventricosum TaxID=4639 RepID=A0A427AEW6_ENSVE|nr:hypothetical protein B296_00006185 [Ensete ventricosum]